MSSSTGAGGADPATGGDADAAKLELWKNELYERCQQEFPEDVLFSQDELLQLDIIPNKDLLLLARVVQSLSDDKLFVTMRESSGQVSWKWRDSKEAHKYQQCSTDEEVMVYSLIDDAGGDGLWSQTIQKRLNMHDSVFKNAVKHLQTKQLITQFKNVEHPNKKMFIKSSIRPSDRATGGPWYTDQNLDEAFIEELQRVVFDYVKRQSSYHSTHSGSGAAKTQVPKKGVLKGPADKSRKRDAAEMTGEAPAKVPKTTGTSNPRRDALLPLPAGYTGYPTVRDIARLLSNSGVTNTVLSEQDVKKLVDVLVWDNLVEPVKIGGTSGRLGYRVARVAKQSSESWAGREDLTGRDGGPQSYISAYTEAPCGRCPVFEICEEGGPVGPSNCEYYQKWLGIEKG